MSGRREMKVGEIGLASIGPRLGELCHGPKVHRDARPSLGKPLVSPLWVMSGRSSGKHDLPFLCRFDQFVKPSADDRYLREADLTAKRTVRLLRVDSGCLIGGWARAERKIFYH
jgi:hypothetical protein